MQPKKTAESWAEFYKLKKEDLEGRDRKELELQNNLHEIVTGEESYMEQLNVLRTMYRDPLSSVEPSIITPKRKDKFLRDVFGRVDAIKQGYCSDCRIRLGVPLTLRKEQIVSCWEPIVLSDNSSPCIMAIVFFCTSPRSCATWTGDMAPIVPSFVG